MLICFCLAAALAALTACGGSSSSTSSGDTDGEVPAALTSYVMPDEISAVPTSGNQDVSRAYYPKNMFRALARSAAGDLSADSDYHTSNTRKYVEEHTLEQFGILEDVLTALNQTHYYDQIGQPAYRAMVIKVGGEGEQASKSLEPWVVEADIIEQNGDVVEPADAVEDGDYNLRVRAWIEEQEGGKTELIRAEFVITEPPTQNDDGSFADYGEWTLNVRFGDSDVDFFAATCEIDADGGNVVTLHEKFEENSPAGDFPMEVAGMMYRSETQGYGKVSYPDWDEMHDPNRDKNSGVLYTEAVYAYNDELLAVQEEDEDDPTYKSRSEEPVEMTHRYGIFNGVTGEDVLKTKSFGFPFFYTDNGDTKRGYYGAWQGRHQIWTDGEDLPPEGTVVTREDWGDPEAEPQTYEMGPTFDGTFVKRTYATAHLDDIKDIPVEIWVNQDYQLVYDNVNEKWVHCTEMVWDPDPQCDNDIDFGQTYGWEILTKNENDTRKHININGWDPTANNNDGENKNFVYLSQNTVDGGNAAGFYEAEEQDHQFRPVMPLIPIDPAKVNQLWAWVSGSLYVEWDGEDWVEKEVVSYNEQYHKPEFGPEDKPYTLPEGRELYVNLQGANYVVRKHNGQTTIKVELQTAANPDNVKGSGALAALSGYTFREPWAENNSTYTFDTDSDSATFLMLVYATIGDNDRDQEGNPKAGMEVGAVVATDLWGIVAYDGSTQVQGSDNEPLAFNWEHDSDSGGMEDWGSVTYLRNTDDTYALLDDPIRFQSITAENNAGDEKTLALQFDGWMMGLPDMYQELQKHNWTMTDELADKIVNLAAGTELTDASDDTEYLLKPMEVSQFLPVVEDLSSYTVPDVTQADDIDLTEIDIYTAPDMGGMPSGTTLLYSEGKLLVE